MATTKTSTKKAKAKRSKSASGSKAKSTGSSPKARSSRPKASSSRSKAGSSRSKNGAPAAHRSSGNGSASHDVADGIKAARDTVEDAGKKAATATGKAVSKAKVPLIASGAALAGVAGGLALNSTRSKGTKVLGMKMPKTKVKIRSKDLVKAADRVAGAGEQIGRVSTGFRELQGTSDADHGNGHHRSPLEVVIESLTRRR
jgi:hypothetical protein